MATDAYVGRRFEGRYEILNLLGRGGMGSVYRALDRSLHKEVAVKLLREDFVSRPDLRQLFLQEAEVAAQLEHPGIVPVYHVSGEGNLLFLVMELIPGGNLAELMASLRRKRQWLPVSEAVEIVRQIALALQYAHDHGILHRDIKPGNVMLRNRAYAGLDYQPVVTDLGLAKVVDQSIASSPLMGTLAYMSPEQVLAQDLDGRTDIYSLGLLLYELLVGKLPFRINTFPEAVKYHVDEPILPPSSIRRDLPKAVENVVLQAVAKNVNERYATAADFAADIDRLGNLSHLGAPPPDAQSVVSLSTIWQNSIVGQMDRLPPPSEVQISQIKGPSLQVRQPDGQFLTIALKARLNIGREENNDLILEDTQVSRRHAVLRRQDDGYTITDLNSTNGTFLNGNRLDADRSYPIQQSDELRIGNHRLRLLLGPGAPAEDNYAFRARLVADMIQGRPGEAVEIPFLVTNQQNEPVRMNVNLAGIDHRWVRPLPPQEIRGKQEERITVIIDLPPDVPPDRHDNRLTLRLVDNLSGDEQSLEAQLRIVAAGVPLTTQATQTAQTTQTTQTIQPPLPPVIPVPERSLPRPILMLAGVLLVLVAAGVGYVLINIGPGPEATSTAMVNGTPATPGGNGEPTPTNGGGVLPAGDSATDTPTPSPTASATPSDTPSPTVTATASPTATPTETATQIPTPTHTSTRVVPPTSTPIVVVAPTDTPAPPATGPTATPTPIRIGPAATSTPTRGVAPTSTRVPATPTHTRTPTPVASPTPIATPAPAGQVEGFESAAGWSSSNTAWGTLVASTEQVQSGSAAAKVTYTFPTDSTNNSYLVLNRALAVGGEPSRFTLWVYGNGSNHYLNIWVADSAGRTYQFSFGRISHQGWRQMTAQVNVNLAWPNQNLADRDDKRPPQYPVRVTALVLDAHPEGQNVNGTIYLDDLRSE